MQVSIETADVAALASALEWMLSVGHQQARRARKLADDSSYASETRASFLDAAASRERQLAAVQRLRQSLQPAT